MYADDMNKAFQNFTLESSSMGFFRSFQEKRPSQKQLTLRIFQFLNLMLPLPKF